MIVQIETAVPRRKFVASDSDEARITLILERCPTYKKQPKLKKIKVLTMNFIERKHKMDYLLEMIEKGRCISLGQVANKDGGAHVDSQLPMNYYVTKQSELQLNILGIETSFERNIAYASVVQIGWELLNSIEL